jgi:hypothetical protein
MAIHFSDPSTARTFRIDALSYVEDILQWMLQIIKKHLFLNLTLQEDHDDPL